MEDPKKSVQDLMDESETLLSKIQTMPMMSGFVSQLKEAQLGAKSTAGVPKWSYRSVQHLHQIVVLINKVVEVIEANATAV